MPQGSVAQLITSAIARILARLFRRPVPKAGLSPRKILIVRCCCLGDVLMTTPALRAISERWPAAEIHYFTGGWSQPAIENNPHVSRNLDAVNVGSGSYSMGEYLRSIASIRVERYDAAFVFERSLWLNLLPALAGIPWRFGIDSHGRGFSLSAGIEPLPDEHERHLFDRVTGVAGLNGEHNLLEFFPTEEATNRADKLLSERGLTPERLVVLHPGGGANPGTVLTRKRWPAERYAGLATRLVEAGWQAALVGTPAERELNEQVDTIAGGTTIELIGDLSFDQLGALLARAAIFIGNDSGTAHLAGAVGCKTLALFGPTSPHTYGPPPQVGRYLWSRPHCSPCFHDGVIDRCHEFICMPAMTVEQVFAAATEMLDGDRWSPAASGPVGAS